MEQGKADWDCCVGLFLANHRASKALQSREKRFRNAVRFTVESAASSRFDFRDMYDEL